MNRKAWSLCLLVCASAAAALAPAASAQKGVLGTGGDPFAGIADTDAGYRYHAVPSPDGSILSKIEIGSGEIEQFRQVGAHLVVPAVAYDFTPGGLSADGDTLVLSEPGVRFPQRRSEFTILDTRTLRTLDRLSFDGTFTYDALSPDGSSLFLIEYTHPRNLTEYVVREYDLGRNRFNPEPIIDPNESAEEMYGSPVTRVTSPDGRWEYTLYDGREHPFIHALDTERAEAVCIDLESVHRVPPYGGAELGLDPDGSTLTVSTRRGPVEVVDTRTFEVAPAPPAADAAAAASAGESGGDEGDGGFAWAVIVGGLALLAIAAALLSRRRRREPVSKAALERLVGVDGDPAAAEAEEERERDPVG